MSTTTKVRMPASGKYEGFVEAQLARARTRIRALDMGGAALGYLIATLAYGLVMALCDRLFDLPALFRQGAFALFLLSSLVYLAAMVIWPLFRRVNPYYAAQQVEHALPGAKNSVVNWLDLRNQQLPSAIRGAVSHRAAKEMARADIDQAISARRTGWLGGFALGLFLAMLVLFFMGPPQFFSLLRRAFAPFIEATIATRTSITILEPEGGDQVVAVGHEVKIVARVDGSIPDSGKTDALKLRFKYNPGDPYEERLLQEEDSRRQWSVVVAGFEVHNGFWYKVTGGDAETSEHRIQVRSTPLLTDFTVAYHYRPYVLRPDQITNDPNLEGLRGTQVRLIARTNRTVKDGRLEIASDKQPILSQSVPDEPQALSFHFPLEHEGRYRIWFASVDGERNTEPMPYTIKVYPDKAPQVELTRPDKEVIELPANGLLNLEGRVTDDFGITAVTLKMAAADASIYSQPYRAGKSFQFEDKSYPIKLDYRDAVELEKVKVNGKALQAGTEVEYWLEATDNCDFPEANVGMTKRFKIKITQPANQKQQQAAKDKAREEQKKHDQEQDQKLQKENEAKKEQSREKDQAKDQDSQKDGNQEDKKPNQDAKQQDNTEPEDKQKQNEEQKLNDQLAKLQEGLEDQNKQDQKKNQDENKQETNENKNDSEEKGVVKPDAPGDKNNQPKNDQAAIDPNGSKNQKLPDQPDQAKGDQAAPKNDQNKNDKNKDQQGDSNQKKHDKSKGEGNNKDQKKGDQAKNSTNSSEKGSPPMNGSDQKQNDENKNTSNKQDKPDKDNQKADPKLTGDQANDKKEASKDQPSNGTDSDKNSHDNEDKGQGDKSQTKNAQKKGGQQEKNPDKGNGEQGKGSDKVKGEQNKNNSKSQGDKSKDTKAQEQSTQQNKDGDKGKGEQGKDDTKNKSDQPPNKNDQEKDKDNGKGKAEQGKNDTKSEGDKKEKNNEDAKAGQNKDQAKGEQAKKDADKEDSQAKKGSNQNQAKADNPNKPANEKTAQKKPSDENKVGANQSPGGEGEKRTPDPNKDSKNGKKAGSQESKGDKEGKAKEKQDGQGEKNNPDQAKGEKEPGADQGKGQEPSQNPENKQDAAKQDQQKQAKGECKCSGTGKKGAGAEGAAKDASQNSPKDKVPAGEDKPASEADKAESRAEAKGDPKKNGGQPAEGNGSKQNSGQKPGRDNEKTAAGKQQDAASGQKEPQTTDVPELIKELKNGDAQVRKSAAKKLEDIKDKLNDPELRKAVEDALKKSGQDEEQDASRGAEKPDAGKDKAPNSQGKEKGKADQPSKAQDEAKANKPTENKGSSGNGKEGAGKGNQGVDTGENKERRNDSGKGPSGKQQADGKEKGEGGAGGSPGSRKGAAGDNGPNLPGDVANAKFQKKAGNLQLEDIKKKINKDVLKKANMTEQEYAEFLKAYEEMMKRKLPDSAGDDKLASPKVRGGLGNIGVRQVGKGAKGKPDKLEHGDPGLAPPEFREAYKDFTEKLSTLEKTREK